MDSSGKGRIMTLGIIDHVNVSRDPNGFVVYGTFLCADCAYWADPDETHSDDWAPLGIDETDSPTHCEECKALIWEPLTSDGIAFVRAALARGDGRAEVLATWREAYAEYLTDDDN